MICFRIVIVAIFLMLQLCNSTAHAYQIQNNCYGDYVGPLKMKTPTVRWRVREGTSEDVRALIQNAFNVWISEGSSQIKAVFAGEFTSGRPREDGFSDFFFDLELNRYGGSTSSTGLTLINGKQDNSCDRVISEADILISQEQINLQQGDLQEVLIHEIGHLLGLSHTFLISAVMFPNRPPAGSFLRNNMQLPKYHLSSDDKAWIRYLYPEEARFKTQISGKVKKNGRAYVGAHIIAVRRGSASMFTIFSNDLDQTLLVDGDEVVSSFSSLDGLFTIPNVSPGEYSLVVQGGNNFAVYDLSNINQFLEKNRTQEKFPLEFWSNPDCGSSAAVSLNDISQSWADAYQLPIAEGQTRCGIEIVAHDGTATCGSTWEEQLSCGTVFCAIGSLPNINYIFPSVLFLFCIFFLVFIRRGIF